MKITGCEKQKFKGIILPFISSEVESIELVFHPEIVVTENKVGKSFVVVFDKSTSQEIALKKEFNFHT